MTHSTLIENKMANPHLIDHRHLGRVNSVEVSGYALVRQTLYEGASELVLTKPIPRQMIERYCHAAMKRVALRQFEDGTWYAEIPGFKGVWANEDTPRDCLNILNDVLVDWLLLKIQSEDHDIPVVDGIDLNVL